MRMTWVVLAMMVACGSWAQPQTVQKAIPPVSRQAVAPNKNQESADNPKQTSDKPSIAVNVSVGGDLNRAAENTQQKTNAESSKWTDPITLFTGLLFVVGILQVWVYWKQKGVMERALSATQTAAEAADMSARAARNQTAIMGNQFDLLREQKNIMQSSLEAAQVAAQAATKSAQASMGSALPNLWLYKLEFADMGVPNLAAKLQSPKIEVTVKNYGGSPAFINQQGIGIFWGAVLPEEPDYSEHAFDVNQETVVESKAPFRLDSVRPCRLVSEEDVGSILSGRYNLWAYGYVQYTDFLGGPHIRRFCKQFVMGGLNPDAYMFVDYNGNPKYIESA